MFFSCYNLTSLLQKRVGCLQTLGVFLTPTNLGVFTFTNLSVLQDLKNVVCVYIFVYLEKGI